MPSTLILLVAIVAIGLALIFADRYRRLAHRLDVRAQQYAALNDAARMLGDASNVQTAVATIARQAVAFTRAFGAYVERAEVPAPDHDVEVVAAAGQGTPPLGTRVPYPGSLTEAIIASGEPKLLTETGMIGERMAPYLRESCRGCSGLIVPLSSQDVMLGALVLLRSPAESPFSDDEAAQIVALAGLASAALRRILLLEALSESEARFRQIADHLREVIWLSNPDVTELYYVNPAYEKVWGLSRESFYRDPGARMDVIHPADRARVEAAFSGLPRGEYDVEYRIIQADGRVRWFRSRGYPIRNERGEVDRVAGITEDVTEHKQSEAERERLLAREREARAEAERRTGELRRVTESRNRLMRGFSHDLKNPLGAADGYLELLEEGVVEPLAERQKLSVSNARRSIRTALELIENLLELARAESGEIEVERAPTDLRDVVRATAEEYRAQAEAEGLKLSFELDDVPSVVDTDADRVRQVVGNLLSNAVKYTERGHVAVRLDVREGGAAPGPGRWIALDVADTGPGIPEAQQDRIFEEFHRLEPPGRERGAGIGLAIGRRVARALGGDVTLESEAGRGSTFTLWLPIQATAPRAGPRSAAD